MAQDDDTLVSSDEEWETVARLATEFFAIVNADGTIRALSPAAKGVLGYSVEEYLRHVRENLPHPAGRLIHPDDVTIAGQSWEDAFAHPAAVSHADYRLWHKERGWRWFQIDLHNLTHDPAIGGLVCHVQDVDERRLMEDELRRSEQRLDALLRNAGGTAMLSTVGDILWVSENGASSLGLDNPEFVEANLAALVHPDDFVKVQQKFLDVAATPGASAQAVSRMRHADGTWRWIESTYTNCVDQVAVEAIVVNVRDVTERAIAEAALRMSELELEHRATHDPLTGLPNRTFLLQRAEGDIVRARDAGTTVALLFLDLDQFKVVNDSQGHPVGDRLLVSVASRLREALPATVMIARFGGDEFVILRSDLDDPAVAVELACDVLATFEAPFSLDLGPDGITGEVYVDASIGIALATQDQTPDDLIRDADTAMYRAKALGRGRYEVFDDKLRDFVVARHDRQVGLRRAIEEDQFEVHFQPIVALEPTGTSMVGAEALVRWRHPTGRLLPPGEFVEQAEDTGLIVPIGQMVLTTACEQWGEMPWEDSFISVNLSARQLSEPSVVSDVAAAIDGSPLSGERLHLEITESALMVDPEASVTALGALKDLGVRISVDDFGTGYSSFAYLRRLPVDCLKIDKTFVDDLAGDDREQALVFSMCQLAHTLGLTVVAEGVETVDQLAVLRDLECDLAQGYLFAQPRPAEELLEMVVPSL